MLLFSCDKCFFFANYLDNDGNNNNCCFSSYPEYLTVTSRRSQHVVSLRVKVYTQADGKVCIHPKSVNAEETGFNYRWLIYHLKMRTSSVSGDGDGSGCGWCLFLCPKRLSEH